MAKGAERPDSELSKVATSRWQTGKAAKRPVTNITVVETHHVHHDAVAAAEEIRCRHSALS